MTTGNEISVIVENGVLRPETPLTYPEHTRLRVRVERVETTAQAEEEARRLFREIRASGVVRLNGWQRPTREELHERP